MKKLKVAIVGCGRIAVCYEDTFMRFPDIVEPVFAVDKDISRARTFADKFPSCRYTDNFDEILKEDIDVVHLCLPHYLHPHMAVKAMQAGIHVITEKPVAITLKEADLMLRTQRETGVKLGVIFQTRYTKSVAALKKMIERGDFGRIVSARSYLTWNRPFHYYDDSDWKGTWDKEGGGVLIDQAIHSIDRVRYLVGSNVSWIDGSIRNYVHNFVKVEDTANAVVMFENGCLYNLYACNTYGLDSPIYIELAGEKGRCGLIHDTGFYEIGDTYEEIQDEYVPTSVGPVYWGSSHYIQLREFYDCVLKDTPVAVDGLEGRKTLEIIKGIYLSSAAGKRVTLPFDDVEYTDINVIKCPQTRN